MNLTHKNIEKKKKLMIPMVAEAIRTVPKNLEKRQEEFEI